MVSGWPNVRPPSVDLAKPIPSQPIHVSYTYEASTACSTSAFWPEHPQLSSRIGPTRETDPGPATREPAAREPAAAPHVAPRARPPVPADEAAGADPATARDDPAVTTGDGAPIVQPSSVIKAAELAARATQATAIGTLDAVIRPPSPLARTLPSY